MEFEVNLFGDNVGEFGMFVAVIFEESFDLNQSTMKMLQDLLDTILGGYVIKNATTNGRSEFDDNVPDPNIITDSIMGAIFRTTSIRDVRANTLEMSRNERSNEQNVQLRIVTISD
ncbi:unnamed protein product [Acanthoscelides obtectus]|uniref:Uncharacterized protein n=1 Tax=Acanthoscelides obtectus TaxID=200917 RepID=A0A9P0LA44_ACAOB|nr:unnamed protein product [Acanthoscelides obtectus]CAK1651660.1 hypothetical protein AOBTE_LOCUS17380 [Acanthoscelides obtectus]